MPMHDEAYQEALIRIEHAAKEKATSLFLGQLRLPISALRDRQSKLTSLDLSENNLTSLSEISNLTSLTSLSLRGNGLTSLPEEVTNLTSLTSLDLSENSLTSLPQQLFNLELRIAQDVVWREYNGKLYLHSNPLERPPLEIVKQGIEAVRAYFAEIEEEDTVKLYEAKLLIVGQGGVGKTYLMNRLIHDEIDPDAISTEGIDIHKWRLQTQQSDQFCANFWDFGGQEIYKATHQFFLTKRSLYLFVWEARTDDDLLSFDYWLNTIKILSDDSPVLVIQNKIDERKKLINQKSWQNKFSNIAGYHDVSAEVGTGVADLREAIVCELEKLPHIGDVLPKRWTDIRQELAGLKENFISYSRYEALCARYDTDEVQAARLSLYYHDLGVFLHFKDSPILRNTIFLNPEWATNAVYNVTDHQAVIDNYGKFHFDQLGVIWQDKEAFPPEKHVELVALMENFELCFELPSGQEYIIPELLLADQPGFSWDDTGNLRFKYVYDFMPAGIITRFIVRAHDLIEEDLYWKDGVVLTWEGARAQVIKTDNRVIEVRIEGNDKKTLLGIVRREMDAIHKPFNNLKVNEMVPCMCDECQDEEEDAPYFYRYKTLQKARKKGKHKVECQKSFDPVSIEDLLGGIGESGHDLHTDPRDAAGAPVEAKPERPPEPRKTIKIFLASSGELLEERREVELFVRRENRKLNLRNIYLDLVVWEDLRHSFQGERIQDYFNEEMLKCEVVVFLFWKKVGDFTKEELDVAYEQFKAGKKPRSLYVYFKSGQIPIAEINEEILKINQLKKEIETAEELYGHFDSKEHLLLQLKHQLELIIPA